MSMPHQKFTVHGSLSNAARVIAERVADYINKEITATAGSFATEEAGLAFWAGKEGNLSTISVQYMDHRDTASFRSQATKNVMDLLNRLSGTSRENQGNGSYEKKDLANILAGIPKSGRTRGQ